MNVNESSILTKEKSNQQSESKESKKEINNMNINNIPYSSLNINPDLNNKNPENNQKEIEELDEIENLRYKDNRNNNNQNKNQRLDSKDSPIKARFKFSIDMPNVPKQRLHEYLSEDLLNALEISPSIPNLNNDIQNMDINVNETDNIINNPNSLFGFSLYPSNIDNNLDNNINNNLNSFSDFNIQQNNNNEFLQKNNIININNNNEINKNDNNYNINKDLISKINIDNPPMYIPVQMRQKEQKNILNVENANYEIKKNKDEKNIPKNKFDKKINNSKKERKFKKHFEVRVGDWTCSKCSNLNFSFRSKCNRCGLPKGISLQIVNQEEYNQKLNHQMMGGINPHFIYENSINDKSIKYYKK